MGRGRSFQATRHLLEVGAVVPHSEGFGSCAMTVSGVGRWGGVYLLTPPSTLSLTTAPRSLSLPAALFAATSSLQCTIQACAPLLKCARGCMPRASQSCVLLIYLFLPWSFALAR